jgi:hypothetical protein
MDMASHNGDPPFTPRIFDANEWTEVYQNLTEDIADVFDLMSPDKLPPPAASKVASPSRNRPKYVGQPHATPQLLRHRLEISVRKPDQAHFSIVDIPGLVRSKSSFLPQLRILPQLISNFDHQTCLHGVFSYLRWSA